jgi:pimeloyl-ACP methyl ester carboxylesterase
MSAPVPFHREAGRGPGVVLLHANASSSSQWRGLLEALPDEFHLLASDAWGAGRSPAWTAARPLCLSDEVALLDTVIARAGEPLALVGHSYGGATALMAALAHRPRVRALVLYEPTLFSLLDADSEDAAQGIREAVAASLAALEADEPLRAAACFIDYWMGPGAFSRMPPERQAAIADATRNVGQWAHALVSEPTPPAALAALDMPVLCMTGRRSPASALAVCRRLRQLLPRIEWFEFETLGHMGPVTHPQLVDPVIADFLRRTV